MFDKLKDRLRQAEGVIPHLYLDSKGFVTCGVGHLLSRAEDAVTLPFLSPSGMAAGEEAIRREFDQVRALEPDKLPAYYAERTVLRLGGDAINELLDADVYRMREGLSISLPGLPGYPDPAQEALLDMAFNLGIGGLTHKFPNLMMAVRAGNWARCATRCHRLDVGDDRNRITSELFDRAASEVANARPVT